VLRAGTGEKPGVVPSSAGRRTEPRSVVDKSPPVIAPSILKHYPDLNDAQKEIVGHIDGPLLVIAGPGSGEGSGLSPLTRVNRQREEPDVQWRAAAFERWHEPDDARVSSPDL
jgi:hypothetical protein